MNKQIEEMARMNRIEECYDLSDIIYMSGYGLHRGECYDIASQIQWHGYRKQTEGCDFCKEGG